VTETEYKGATAPEALAGAIEKMLLEWPEGTDSAKITLNMTRAQWAELLDALHLAEAESLLTEAEHAVR
jgi:hypothetical protein